MKTLKIVLALTAVIGLVAVTIGLSFAHYTGIPVDTTTNTVHDTFDENWWTNIREYMEAKWNGIEDEAWFNEMTQYMEEHYNEVQNQEWFNQGGLLSLQETPTLLNHYRQFLTHPPFAHVPLGVRHLTY